jgi:fructose-1,6-bisphosphatase/inositol monophosphatase family enzyme
MLVGVLALAAALSAVGRLDPMLLFGVVIWDVALGCLLARSTRNALAG